MAISRNGWDIYSSGSHSRLIDFPWVTGKVRNGDHYVVLDYIAKRWNTEVEPIRKEWSWGYAYRPVRGALVISEHATGTAADFNAPLHPLGVPASKTFSAKQIATIRRIIRDTRGTARWGGEWSRPDAMHVELVGGNARIRQVADLIRAGKLPNSGDIVKPISSTHKPAPKPKPKPKKTGLKADSKWGSDTTRLAQQVAGTPVDGRISGQERQHRVKHLTTGWVWVAPGRGQGSQLIAHLQEDLKRRGLYKGKIDGIAGTQFWAAFKKAQKAKTIRGAIHRFQLCLPHGRFWTKK